MTGLTKWQQRMLIVRRYLVPWPMPVKAPAGDYPHAAGGDHAQLAIVPGVPGETNGIALLAAQRGAPHFSCLSGLSLSITSRQSPLMMALS
jgi:hypothetical protein